MRVRVVTNDKTILSNGVLIEGRSYGRIADLLDGFGISYSWQDKGYEGIILAKRRDILGTALLNDVQLTNDFNMHEFQCRHCQAVKIDPELMRRLQVLRNKAGVPLSVSSGYRCPEHNRAVGGAEDSQHVKGTAADLKSSLPVKELHGLAESVFADGGLGSYTWGIHVDTRGHRARW